MQVLDPLCDRCYGARVAAMRKRQGEDRARCSGPGHYGSVSWWYWLSGEGA